MSKQNIALHIRVSTLYRQKYQGKNASILVSNPVKVFKLYIFMLNGVYTRLMLKISGH